MFFVYVDHARGRVLVSRERLPGLRPAAVRATWRAAYRRALELADREDYVLEWDMEDVE